LEQAYKHWYSFPATLLKQIAGGPPPAFLLETIWLDSVSGRFEQVVRVGLQGDGG
jgi:hypothetical protein